LTVDLVTRVDAIGAARQLRSGFGGFALLLPPEATSMNQTYRRAKRTTAGIEVSARLSGFVLLAFLGTAAHAEGADPVSARAKAAGQLFVQNCVQCHGQDGRGGPARPTMPDIPDFTNATWQRGHTDPQLVVSVLEGKGRLMPAWWGRLSDVQAADLVAYVRMFGPARAVATETAPSEYSAQFEKLRQQWDELQQQVQALPAPTTAPAVTGGAGRFFGQNCAGCHTIGGGALTGPDLKNVTQRRDRAWLVNLLLDPKSVIHSGDPYALELLAKARGIIMPNIFGMTRERADAMLDFIETQSKMDKSWFSELPISDRPLTAEDAARGRETFAGRAPLTNGGPSCMGCHTAGDVEGGQLGPDLTKVYERVGGRTALTARLWTPVTPTMLPVYQQHPLQDEEVLGLVAYLETTAREGVEHGGAPPVNLLLLGLGGAVVGVIGVNFLWGNRSTRQGWPNGESDVVSTEKLGSDQYFDERP
jgi:mono/diheme cytochrome c family protein